jgi:hypothetical protein
VKNVKKKVLMLTVVAILALLTSSIVVVSQGWMSPKPKYVDYTFRVMVIPSGSVITSRDTSNLPVVVVEGYYPSAAIASANVTINDVTYTCPKDFDYNFSFHMELNTVTGFGLMLIQETLYFKNLPGHPTLNGRTEEKATGYMVPYDKFEFSGNFQLTGTKMFRGVEGYGAASFGASTGFVSYHFAQISGWLLR